MEFIPCHFQLLEDAIIPCFMTPFSNSIIMTSAFIVTSSLILLLPSYKDPLIISGPPAKSRTLSSSQDPYLTTPVNALLSCKVSYPQFPGIGIWAFWKRRALFFLPH